MTEQQYIDVTNLAKINIAIATLKDALFEEGSSSEALQKVTLKALYRIRDLTPI